ncbi:MAG: helix-turn-helix domain-containing protein [Kiritimatiellae bacterium]|nr:helix-turn-helix domain-containing protein [Kiritimatiellia bacterium]
MSVEMLQNAMQPLGLTPTQQLVLIALAMRHNIHNGECYPSLADIRGLTGGRAKRNVQSALISLQRKGLIRVSDKPKPNGIGHSYELTLPRKPTPLELSEARMTRMTLMTRMMQNNADNAHNADNATPPQGAAICKTGGNMPPPWAVYYDQRR